MALLAFLQPAAAGIQKAEGLCNCLQVDREEVSGPEAEAAIARITQRPPSVPEGAVLDPHVSASKPTASALAEHDAAFPAIGALNGMAGPGKSPEAMNGSASVVATIGEGSVAGPGALDAVLDTAPSSVSVCLTVGDEGEDVLVALTLDRAERCASTFSPSVTAPFILYVLGPTAYQ